MDKSEIVKILNGKGTSEDKAQKISDAYAEREKEQADPGQIVKRVEVNTGDDGSNVVSHASSYGLHIGVDQHGKAREVSFDRGARIVNADGEK